MKARLVYKGHMGHETIMVKGNVLIKTSVKLAELDDPYNTYFEVIMWGNGGFIVESLKEGTVVDVEMRIVTKQTKDGRNYTYVKLERVDMVSEKALNTTNTYTVLLNENQEVYRGEDGCMYVRDKGNAGMIANEDDDNYPDDGYTSSKHSGSEDIDDGLPF